MNDERLCSIKMNATLSKLLKHYRHFFFSFWFISLLYNFLLIFRYRCVLLISFHDLSSGAIYNVISLYLLIFLQPNIRNLTSWHLRLLLYHRLESEFHEWIKRILSVFIDISISPVIDWIRRKGTVNSYWRLCTRFHSRLDSHIYFMPFLQFDFSQINHSNRNFNINEIVIEIWKILLLKSFIYF